MSEYEEIGQDIVDGLMLDNTSDENKKRQREAVIEEALSAAGKQELRKALRDMVLSTPYSATIAMMTGRGSLVAPTEAEVQEEIVTSGLTYEEAYAKLHEQNLRKHDDM